MFVWLGTGLLRHQPLRSLSVRFAVVVGTPLHVEIFSPMHMSNPQQLVRFVVVGSAGLVLNMVCTYAFTEVVGLWYFWAFIIGTLVAWTASFLLNSAFTFPDHRKERMVDKYVSYLLLYALAFAFNAGLVYCLTSFVKVHYLISIGIAAVATTAITYSLTKALIFAHDPYL